MDAYLTTVDARDLAASLSTLPGMAALVAKDDDTLAILLLIASIEIDSAVPYQGVRYEATQVREFPRIWGSGQCSVPGTPYSVPSTQYSVPAPGVWDWDADTNAAVVPQAVKLATLVQAAASLSDPGFRGRLEAIRSGLASQSVGSLSESYVKAADLPGGLSGGGLCSRAQQLMDRYRLRSGAML